MNLSHTHNSQDAIFFHESSGNPLDSVNRNGMDFGMKNREGADASQAGTSGGRGKWLPRDHHYPLAPAARPIRAGGCSGCVTSGDPFPRYPKALRLQTGGTAERGQPPQGQLGDQFDAGALGALEAGALGQLSAAAASFRGSAGPGDRPEPSPCPRRAALGHPPRPLLCCPWLCRRWGGGKHRQHAAPCAVGLGDRQQCRCHAPWCRWPRHAGSVVGRVALPGQNRPSYPASRRRAARGVAGRVTRKRLLARPGNTGGQDRLQADGRRAAGPDRVPICRRPRGAAAPARAQPR